MIKPSAIASFGLCLPLMALGQLDPSKPLPRYSVAPAVPANVESEAAAGSPETAEASEEATPAAIDLKPKPVQDISLRLRANYDYKKLGDDEDNDLYLYFYGSGRALWQGKLDFYTSMRQHTDYDTPVKSSLADDPLLDLDDVKSVSDDRIMQMYVDVHTVDKVYAFRGGRQYIEVADYLQLDGGQLMIRDDREFGGRVYFGHPVSYYTSVSGDYAGGLSFAGRPWDGNQSRLTLARYFDDSQDDYDQDYFVDIRQNVSDLSGARTRLSILNDEFRMAQVDMFYFSEDGETDFTLGGSYWGSFDAKTRVYSPLYATLGEQDPYTYLYARLNKEMIPSWIISPGASIRLAEESDSEYSNRDYSNYDIALIFSPNRAFNASVSLEYWEVNPYDSFWGLSGDIRYRKGRIWEIAGGATYAQYKYDTYSDFSYTVSGGQTVFSDNGTIMEESPYVKTYFIRGRWRLSKALTLRGQFDIEDNDVESDLAYRARASIEVRY